MFTSNDFNILKIYERGYIMKPDFNTIGINDNLNRERIKKLLTFGVTGAIITGVGDFLLGYGDETSGTNLATNMMSTAPNLSDLQMILGGLLGVIGIFLEGLAYFAVYRLVADTSPKYTHIIRTGIFGYIWLAPVGTHMNIGLVNLAYKYLLLTDSDIAITAATKMFMYFSLPIYILLILFWLPMIIVQYKAFSKGYTLYPTYAKHFNIILGGLPALILSVIIGPGTSLGGGIGTMFLSFGSLLLFGGLLVTLPGEERFKEFRESLDK